MDIAKRGAGAGAGVATIRRETDEEMARLTLRVHAEYREMPGMRLTVPQAARLFSLPHNVAHSVLDELQRATVLTCSSTGVYSLTS